MQVYWLIGIVLFLVVLYKDPQVLKVDVNAIYGAIKFILIIKLLYVVLSLLLPGFLPSSSIAPPLYMLPMVWWEDLVFSLIPILYSFKYLPRSIAIAITVVVSVLFGLGHAYQGWYAILALSFYPYFISYRYGRSYGYGTVMIVHVLYDIVTVASMYFADYINGMIHQ